MTNEPDNPYIVVLDACVLVPMPLCDTLLRLAEAPAFYLPKWSREILRELRSTLVRMGYSSAQADRRLAAMQSAFGDALVENYESLIDAMTNDPKDRHVLAAAVRCGAHGIVTRNLKHFLPEAAKPYGLDTMSPDEFLLHQAHFDSDLVLEKLVEQAAARSVTLESLLIRLEKHAPECVSFLRGTMGIG
jgi:predicted nucleic acid-binding protein